MTKYGVEYAVVGPHERMFTSINEAFFSKFQQVGEVGDYKLYKIK